MVRAKLWFKCAAMHDPVSPIIVQPCLVGWDAKKRKIDLVMERIFTGEELALRMKGWVTVDPAKVIEVVRRHGRLIIFNKRELFVEAENINAYAELVEELKNAFGDEVEAELVEA